MALNAYKRCTGQGGAYWLTVGTPVLLVTAALTGGPVPYEKPEAPRTQYSNCACEKHAKLPTAALDPVRPIPSMNLQSLNGAI